MNCNPLLLRLAWHDAGTYDKTVAAFGARGGANGSIRFAPEISMGANNGLAPRTWTRRKAEGGETLPAEAVFGGWSEKSTGKANQWGKLPGKHHPFFFPRHPASTWLRPGVDGTVLQHRCPFWLFWSKNRWPWFAWWFHLPGKPIYFPMVWWIGRWASPRPVEWETYRRGLWLPTGGQWQKPTLPRMNEEKSEILWRDGIDFDCHQVCCCCCGGIILWMDRILHHLRSPGMMPLVNTSKKWFPTFPKWYNISFIHGRVSERRKPASVWPFLDQGQGREVPRALQGEPPNPPHRSPMVGFGVPA